MKKTSIALVICLMAIGCSEKPAATKTSTAPAGSGMNPASHAGAAAHMGAAHKAAGTDAKPTEEKKDAAPDAAADAPK